MKLLLDTHILLWWLSDSKKLGKAIRALISNEDNIVMVSAASAWEISIKQALGKLEAPDDLSNAIKQCQFTPLNITIIDASLAGKLPKHHEDPFDRMLIAQTMNEDLTLISNDKHFEKYNVALITA